MNGIKAVVGCLLAGLVTAAAGSSATNPTNRFAVIFQGAGSYTVDFGEDRLEEKKKKPTSGGGVDGNASVSWSWTLKTVASQSGDKPVLHNRAILQASYQLSGGFLVYSFFRDGEMSERPIACDWGGNHRTFDGEQRAALRGDWVKWSPLLRYDADRVSFGQRIPRALAPSTVACYHSTAEVNEGSPASPAYLPGTFAYRPSAFDLAVGNTYIRPTEESIDLPRSHAFDLPQAHTVNGQLRSAITITRISDETWRKRAKKYRESPKFDTSDD